MTIKQLESYFQDNQKLLLKLANSEAGKNLLFSIGITDIGKDNIIKIEPYGVHVQRDIDKKKKTVQGYFLNVLAQASIADAFLPSLAELEIAKDYLISRRQWREAFLQEAFDHYSNFKNLSSRYPQILLNTDTFTNQITGGMAILSTSSGDWNTIRNGNNLSVGDIWADFSNCGLGARWDGSNYQLIRFWFHFNTAALTTDATLVSAFIRLTGTTTSSQNGDSDTFNIVQSTGASNTTIATSDWGNLGTTVFGSISYASFNTSGTNDFTLDSNGLANISKTGYSKFAARDERDRANSAPTGLNSKTIDKSSSLANQILSITYTLPATGGGIIMF